jgi:hypothetical protein
LLIHWLPLHFTPHHPLNHPPSSISVAPSLTNVITLDFAKERRNIMALDMQAGESGSVEVLLYVKGDGQMAVKLDVQGNALGNNKVICEKAVTEDGKTARREEVTSSPSRDMSVVRGSKEDTSNKGGAGLTAEKRTTPYDAVLPT